MPLRSGPIAESQDGRWLVTVDAGYIESMDESRCNREPLSD
jgi:hypothetical protein